MGIREIIEQCRLKQLRYERRIPVQLEIPLDVASAEENERLMEIYREQSDFMQTLRAATTEIVWASEYEAWEEWRSRTFEDWGFYPGWVGA